MASYILAHVQANDTLPIDQEVSQTLEPVPGNESPETAALLSSPSTTQDTEIIAIKAHHPKMSFLLRTFGTIVLLPEVSLATLPRS